MFDLVIWTLLMAASVFIFDFVISFGQALRAGATDATGIDPIGHRPEPATTWVHITMAGPSYGRRDHVFQETTSQSPKAA